MPGTRSNYTTLRRVPLFHAVKPDALRELAASAVTIEVRHGNPVFRRGDRNAGIYIVLSGTVLLSVSGPRGLHKVVRILGPAGNMGIAATMLNVPHLTDAEAATDCRLLLIPRQGVRAGIAHSNEFTLGLATALSEAVRSMTEDIGGLSLCDGRERLGRYLTQIAVAGAPPSRTVTLPAKKSVVASRLGITPEYLSRILRELAETGAIAMEGRRITILDQGMLREPDPA